MTIKCRVNAELTPEELAGVFERSGINRPVRDMERLRQMLAYANLTVTAWDSETLVGAAQALTDFSWCCYLPDLAGNKAYQHCGIGRELIARPGQEGWKDAWILLSL